MLLRRTMCFLVVLLPMTACLGGCGSGSDTTVIEQPADMMTPEYIESESAVGSGKPTPS